MGTGQLDRALAVLVGCERFRPSLRAGLVEGAPGLCLRYDHYASRHRAHAFPDLAGTERYGRHAAYVDRFLDVALPRAFALAQALRTSALARPEARPAAADAALDRLAEAVEPDLALVEAGFGQLAAILCATIAANLTTKPNRVFALDLPETAVAIEATLDGEVRHGWDDGLLRLTLVGAEGPYPAAPLRAVPELPAPFLVETLAPEPGTGRPRLRITWPDGARPKALRLQQHGGWPSPQAQLRLTAVAPDARTDLNPVKTALDLVALLGQLSRESVEVDGHSLPLYGLGWRYLLKNDFSSLHELQVAFGFENPRLADLIAAAAVHNHGMPASLQRVVGRSQFSKPLGLDRHEAAVRQAETLAGLLEAEFGLEPFLTHATLMACMSGGVPFADEERLSLAVVIKARTTEEVAAFGESVAARLEARAKARLSRSREILTSLVVRLAEADDPVPIEVLIFWRDGTGHVHGVAEGARVIALEADWLDAFDTAALAGRPMRVPRRWRSYLADVSGSRWSSLGQPYGMLSSFRADAEGCLREVWAAGRDPAPPVPLWRPSRLPGDLFRWVRSMLPRRGPDRHGSGTRWRLVGTRDLAADPEIRVTSLAAGRHFVRPAADLVVDLSDRDYQHDLAAPARMPLSPVAMVETPPGTVVRGTILLALPDGRLFLPKHARYDGARTFVDLIRRAHEFNPPLSDFFSGLGRSRAGDIALSPQPIRDIPGDVFWASPDEWENWGVWLMQTLPAIVHAERIGFDGALLCRAATAWQRRFIEIFAPRLAERLIVQETAFAYRIGGRLTMIAQDTRTMAQTAFQRDIYAEVAERALRAVAAVPGEERIFVSRLSHSQRHPTYRSLVNEPDLIAALGGLGFHSVEPEQRGILEQIALFARAREIAGLGGAGMFNLLFTPPGASVLDIESSPGWVTSHTNIFATSDLRFGVLFGQPIEDAGVHSRWTLPLDRAMVLIRSFFGMDAL